MRSLVIGGTRNVGPDLVATLVERGDSVTILNRGVTPVGLGSTRAEAGRGQSIDAAVARTEGSATLPPGVTRLFADRSDAAALSAALGDRSFDLVVDTTLYTGPDAKAVARILDGRCGRYVLWSTGQVYLVRTGIACPFREEDYDGPVMPDPLLAASVDESAARRELDHRNWDYGIGKRAAEDALLAAHAERWFPVVILRMPMINSERDHYGRIAGYVHRLLDGGPLLLPREEGPRLRHVYGKDVVAATLLAGAAADAGHAYNISQDETLTLGEMIARLAELVGRRAAVREAPLGTLVERGLIPPCSPFSDPWMSSLTNDLGKRALGMRYTRVDDYLPRVVEAAMAIPRERVPGYERREEELRLAAQVGA